jgi:outer membrane protein OmpA-like peptidoglycan-associated protein
VVMVRGTCGKPKPAQPPMLLEPANGARLEMKRPSFSWEAMDGIKEYQIEIADNEMFDPVMVQTTVMGTSYKPMTDMADGSYYWHVRAKKGKDWGMWQDYAWMFTIYTPEPPKPEVTLATIHFDFDKSDIRMGDAKTLEENARKLKDAAGMGYEPEVMIEGNCDPIGTSEYNMALGQRRADAAKAFLVKMGVPEAQLSTISYGEEKLVTQKESEYEMNRRDEFKVE